ncbi:APC family permease [Mycoplasma procyoni]|uniref:APC family permease n=1 Tax=Mycoplasma procyoni TaxID=568784 RepID=UPI00197C56A4|nr:APC family permease [Mycoplasma procyoni]MBN3534883.1 APC family permease [Mycoplasma procyoni]
MSKHQAKKIGFFLALMMLIGSVVGIGIFFKNASISKATGGDGLSWLLAWVAGGIISVAAAINFSEIGTFKPGKLSGLSHWTYKTTGSAAGYAISVTYTLFYWGLLFTVLGSFFAEILFFFLAQVKLLEFSEIPLYAIILVGILFSIFFLVLNHISIKAVAWLQTVVSVIKFLPLIVAIFAGIIAVGTHNNQGTNAFIVSPNGFTIKGIIVALPSVLFAYDAFLVTGSLGNKIKNPRKNLFWVILIGMVAVVVLYSLIAVSSILHNQGFVWSLLLDSLPKESAKYIVPIVTFFIMISAMGVVNGISAAFAQELHNAIETDVFFGSNALKKRFKSSIVEYIYSAIFFVFWGLLFLVPSSVLNHDSLLDGATNFPTVLFFGVYAFVIGSYALNRHKNTETKKLNKWVFYVAAGISVVSIAVVEVAYFVAIIQDLINPNFSTTWGLFYDAGVPSKTIHSYLPLTLWILSLVFCISFPIANFYLEKLVFKRNIISDLEVIQQRAQAEYERNLN